jgi:hypothetical protein
MFNSNNPFSSFCGGQLNGFDAMMMERESKINILINRVKKSKDFIHNVSLESQIKRYANEMRIEPELTDSEIKAIAKRV